MFRGKLFVIDDSADHLELIESTVHANQTECDLHMFQTGDAALSYLASDGTRGQSGKPCPAVVLLDWKLPTMSGEEVLKGIRRTAGIERLPVVVMSSSREEVDVANAYAFGANSFLNKPVNYEDYKQTLFSLTDYWLKRNEPPPSA